MSHLEPLHTSVVFATSSAWMGKAPAESESWLAPAASERRAKRTASTADRRLPRSRLGAPGFERISILG